MAEGRTDRSEPNRPLRSGWTTGACATAAAKSACSALFTGVFLDPVAITLPKGQTPSFALALEERGADFARAGIVKDAGDDPDVTHGCLVIATLRRERPGSGVVFRAGEGVGTVTKPGLPLPPGEPAINPVPRRMIRAAVEEIAAACEETPDLVVEIGIPGGEAIAAKTWNPRLGILGGLSILGTTGIVTPYSCSAWIHSIHRGVDVARAIGLTHVVGSTGATSEDAARRRFGLPEEAYLDMGDFVGGLLKYLRRHPVPRVTIAGGFAKLTKLAEGHLDLHSGRSQVEITALARTLEALGASPDLVGRSLTANTALEVLGLSQTAGLPLADAVAREARARAAEVVGDAGIAIDVLVVDRQGQVIAASE
jgi:cobalt-precorrin-5B (C1)-methyltransferase